MKHGFILSFKRTVRVNGVLTKNNSINANSELPLGLLFDLVMNLLKLDKNVTQILAVSQQ